MTTRRCIYTRQTCGNAKNGWEKVYGFRDLGSFNIVVIRPNYRYFEIGFLHLVGEEQGNPEVVLWPKRINSNKTGTSSKFISALSKCVAVAHPNFSISISTIRLSTFKSAIWTDRRTCFRRVNFKHDFRCNKKKNIQSVSVECVIFSRRMQALNLDNLIEHSGVAACA